MGRDGKRQIAQDFRANSVTQADILEPDQLEWIIGFEAHTGHFRPRFTILNHDFTCP